MIEFNNGVRLVEDVSELPNIAGARDVFADFETSSGNPKLKSLNPWHNCYVAGIGVAVDKAPGAWYIPVTCWDAENGYHAKLEPEAVTRWWHDVISNAERWINHNVKYDAHVSANALGVLPTCKLVDTLTLAKIIDSDRIMRGGYSLKALAKGWLHEDIAKYEDSLQAYLGRNNNDYGRIPVDILAEYGGQDVLTNRRLWQYIAAACPDECARVWRAEIDLTPVLFQMERNGLRVNPQELQITELLLRNKLQTLDDELTKLVGFSFRPHVSGDCFDVLCNHYGLPVMKWTNPDDEDKVSNPSFDKEAMSKYAAHPYAPQDVIGRMREYSKINTQLSHFIEPYRSLHRGGLLHSYYNQAVRTGRMSCSMPNAQQLDGLAKSLIHPAEGCSFLAIDYAQIEFRLIVHYIRDIDAMSAYAADPDTDFHSWVAKMCGIHRKPAKTVNFLMGYGGGRKLLVGKLAQDPELIGALKAQVDEMRESGTIAKGQEMSVFQKLCKQRAEEVYTKYHDTLPGIKTTSWRAANALKRRGHVRNLYGRWRKLPYDRAHRAFNSLNQSSAADMMKDRTIATAELISGTPIEMVATVHDEILFHGPSELMHDTRTVRDLVYIMEDVQVEGLRVPIRVSAGISDDNWKIASGDDGEMKLPRDTWGGFGALAHCS
jgi:DNA polymerase-1